MELQQSSKRQHKLYDPIDAKRATYPIDFPTITDTIDWTVVIQLQYFKKRTATIKLQLISTITAWFKRCTITHWMPIYRCQNVRSIIFQSIWFIRSTKKRLSIASRTSSRFELPKETQSQAIATGITLCRRLGCSGWYRTGHIVGIGTGPQRCWTNLLNVEHFIR